MRAVILAGGRGTRLRPFTASFPKPLVPLEDTPVVEVLIQTLMRHGIFEVTLTLGHLAELVQAYFSQRQHLLERLQLSYVVEAKPTGTAGSLALVPRLDETFLVMNCDLLTDLDFRALVTFHREQQAMLTIATQRREVKIDLGVIEFKEAQISNYIEKPEHVYYVSMGVYVYEPAVLKYINSGEYLDFPDLVLRLLAHRQRVCAYLTDSLWLDIGRPDDYANAQQLFSEHKERFTFDAHQHSA